LRLKPGQHGEDEFEDAKCGQCKKTIPESEVKAIFGQEYEAQIENKRIQIFLSKQDGMIQCSCGN